MGHEQHRARIFPQHLLQGLLADDIHMIGGLVQNQQIGPGLQHLAQGQPHLLAAGKLAHEFRHILPGEQKAPQGAAHLLPHIMRILFPEIVQYGLPGVCVIQHRFLLVKISPLHILSEFELPSQSGQFPDKSPQQCGFSFAVLPDDGKALLLLQEKTDSFQFTVIPDGKVSGLHHIGITLDPGLIPGMKGPGVKTPGLLDLDHMLNHHALGPGGRHLGGRILPFLYPLRQPLDLLLLLLIVLFLLHQSLLLLSHKGGVITHITPDPVILDLVSYINHLVQEHSVMGYNDHRLVIVFQLPPQPLDGGQVQMVGGLVQKHDVRPSQQQLNKSNFGLLPSRKTPDGTA